MGIYAPSFWDFLPASCVTGTVRTPWVSRTSVSRETGLMMTAGCGFPGLIGGAVRSPSRMHGAWPWVLQANFRGHCCLLSLVYPPPRPLPASMSSETWIQHLLGSRAMASQSLGSQRTFSLGPWPRRSPQRQCEEQVVTTWREVKCLQPAMPGKGVAHRILQGAFPEEGTSGRSLGGEQNAT